MKYPKEYLEEIKTRIKVSQVVSKTVNLKKRGKEFVGLSPFSNEKTPSFTVNDEKAFYHCFSTSEHGNIFDFVMKTEGLKFGEAVRKLATEAGMPIYKFTKYDEEKEKKWNIYKEILNQYVNFYNEQLNSSKFEIVKKYLDNRLLTNKEIDFFRLGYVEKTCNFYSKISDKFNNEDIIASGLFYFDESKKKFFERFRGRIIFPIKNSLGSIIGLGGRIINNSNFAKYINSPETMFFKKGNNLYNIDNAKKLSTEYSEILLVEGYMDVITLHKHGIKNVVANQGTALTERQLDLAWRYFKNIVVCFDGDSSGKQAAIRSAEKLFSLIKPNYNIYFLFLPDELDPDSFLNQKGKSSFKDLLESKIPIYDFLWNVYLNQTDKQNPSSFAFLEKKIELLSNQVQNNSLKKYFKEYFLNKISNLTPLLNSKNKNNYKKYFKIAKPLNETKIINSQKNRFTKRKLKEYSLVYLIINNLNIFQKKMELISEINFSDQHINKFLSKLTSNLNSENKIEQGSFDDFFNNSEFKPLIKEVREFAPIKQIANNIDERAVEIMLEELCVEMKKIDLDKKIENLENKMAEQMDEETYNEILSLKIQQKGS